MSDLDMPPRIEGEARSPDELRFYLLVHACPTCGSRDCGSPETNWYMTEGRGAGHYDVTCPGCGTRRRVAFFETTDFPQAQEIRAWKLPERIEDAHLGGAAPSTILGPHEFAAELAREHPPMRSDLSEMSLADANAQLRVVRHSLTASLELRKFLPDGAPCVPLAAFRTPEARAYRDQHAEQFERGYIEQEVARWIAFDDASVVEMRRRAAASPPTSAAEREPMAQPMSSLSLKLHAAWLDGRGGEQLRATGVDATERAFPGARFASAVLDHVGLEHANLFQTDWFGAVLAHCRLRGSKLGRAIINGASVTATDLSFIHARALELANSALTDCTLQGAELSSASLRGSGFERCTLQRARLANAQLEGTRFVGCDLRYADLTWTVAALAGAARRGTEFIRCDLRDTDWTGRDQSNITFTECQLDGATGLSVAGTLEAALARGATFEETVAALRALGLTQEQAYHAVIDPARVGKPRG
jgi:uncharacterized protein YjbI with pentapeptide repeats